jgi:hypothetical protein
MDKRLIMGLVTAVLAAGLAACDSGPSGPVIDPNSGQITGTIAIEGPFDATQPLNIGLLAGTDFMVEQVDVGKVTSLAGASLFNRAIHYSFTHEFVSVYRVQVFTGDPPNRHVWFESQSVSLGFASTTAKVDGSFNFSGPGPYGSLSGTVTLTGTWPASGSVFIGLTPAGNTSQLLRWPVDSAAASGGSLPFTVPATAYGTYSVGLYAADAQGTVHPLGMAPGSFTISSTVHDVTGADFSADLGS